jgi:hypothetical protein
MYDIEQFLDVLLGGAFLLVDRPRLERRARVMKHDERSWVLRLTQVASEDVSVIGLPSRVTRPSLTTMVKGLKVCS